MEKFKSKTDLWLILFLVVTLGGSALAMLYNRSWAAFFVLFFTIAFVVHMFLTTYYIIDKEKLFIRSGFLVYISIEIKNIKKISETFNVMSSPALSLDRLEIVYGKSYSVLISPKNKKEFFEVLKSINPEVEIVEKK